MNLSRALKLVLTVSAVVLVSCRKVSDTPDTPFWPDDPDEPKEEVVPVPDSVGTGLPVVYIRTAGGAAINSKDTYINATVQIAGIGKYPDLVLRQARIKGRGNTTWNWYPKKAYHFQLNSKASVLGMPENKHWILLANFMDRTMMRNIVALKLGSLTSLDWTPRFVPVEVVLNGVHRGSYLLTEQVRVGEDRCPVSKTNGVLLELDYHQDEDYMWVSPYGNSYDKNCQPINGITFMVKNPDEPTQAQFSAIKSYVDSVAAQVFANSQKLVDCLDLQSFVDYFLVFELMGNSELGNPGSVYFHYEPGGKIKAGPLWDFDWGTLTQWQGPTTKAFLNKKAIWYKALLGNDTFKRVLKSRWKTLKPSFETIPAYIEENRALLSASAVKNFAMWDPTYDKNFNGGNLINKDESLTFDQAVDRIKAVYTARIATLDTLINSL